MFKLHVEIGNGVKEITTNFSKGELIEVALKVATIYVVYRIGRSAGFRKGKRNSNRC